MSRWIGHVGLPGQRVEHRRRAAARGRTASTCDVELLVDRHLGGRGPRAALGSSRCVRDSSSDPPSPSSRETRSGRRTACSSPPHPRPRRGSRPAVSPSIDFWVSSRRIIRLWASSCRTTALSGASWPAFLAIASASAKPPLVDERVVFLDEHRDPLVDLDPLGTIAVDLGLDLRRSACRGRARRARLPVASSMSRRVRSMRRSSCAFVSSGSGWPSSPSAVGVEQVEGVGGRLLRRAVWPRAAWRPPRRRSGQAGDCPGWRPSAADGFGRGAVSAGLAACRDRLLDHPAGGRRVGVAAPSGAGRSSPAGSAIDTTQASDARPPAMPHSWAVGVRSRPWPITFRGADERGMRGIPSCGRRFVGREKYPPVPPRVKGTSGGRNRGKTGSSGGGPPAFRHPGCAWRHTPASGAAKVSSPGRGYAQGSSSVRRPPCLPAQVYQLVATPSQDAL